MPSDWLATTYESRSWQSAGDGYQSRRARGPYQAAVPAQIADQNLPQLDIETTIAAEDAVTELARFDAEVGTIAAPFAAVLLRSESASSSEIENLTARPKSIALAELGRKSGANARLIVGNVRAMQAAIELADQLDEDSVIEMQRVLLVDTHPEFTGSWRTQQVWIGGVGNSPHSAAFVPPHHERVADLMRDLVTFATRVDIPVLPQIAIAHAQFETIHPFPDCNGRTGRALVQSMLRRLGITQNVTVPLSAGLLQDIRRYFDALTAYRSGDVTPIIQVFSAATFAAISNGRQLVAALQAFETSAYERTTARKGSAGWRTIEVLTRQPVVDAQSVASHLGITAQNAQNGIDRLVSDGILQQIGNSRRNRVYEAAEVLVALDEFARRARRRR